MRETLQFRIPERLAALHLPELQQRGRSLGGGFIRCVELPSDDPLVWEIGRLEQQLRPGEEGLFFTSWDVRREYTRGELCTAAVLHARVVRVFEPAGEECGTQYDDTQACSQCGAGAPQVTALRLPAAAVPRDVDFAATISGELILSRRAVETLCAAELSGMSLEPLLMSDARDARSAEFQQLSVLGPCVELHESTRAGSDPFDLRSSGMCSRGHLAGLNLLSEVTVTSDSMVDADFVLTRQMIGIRQGLLRPRQVLLLSQRAWLAIEEAGLRGLSVEVAHVC